jgi:Flp pilus assembly protein TadB
MTDLIVGTGILCIALALIAFVVWDWIRTARRKQREREKRDMRAHLDRVLRQGRL